MATSSSRVTQATLGHGADSSGPHDKVGSVRVMTPTRSGDLLCVQAWPLLELPANPDVAVVRRPVDFGVSRWRAAIARISTAVRLGRRAARHDRLFLASAGSEIVLMGLLHRVLFRRTELVVLDPILGESGRADLLRRLGARGVNQFIVIRRGDAATLRAQWGVPPARSRFVRFPSPSRVGQFREGAREDGPALVYSAGSAFRDWPTLVAALEQLPGTRAVLSGCPASLVPPSLRHRVECRGTLSVEEGRILLLEADIVALALVDTVASSGPLVLLDALAAGKAVVVTDVNGTRDYVEHGRTGLLAQAGSVDSLRDALEQAGDSADRRAELGAHAREWSAANTATQFWKDVMEAPAV
jgi:glycosyltransferase involved in cell wall biosynthesis